MHPRTAAIGSVAQPQNVDAPVRNSFSATFRCMYSTKRTVSACGPAAAMILCESSALIWRAQEAEEDEGEG